MKKDLGIKSINRGDESSVGGCVGRFFFQSRGGLFKTRESDLVFGNRGIVKKIVSLNRLPPSLFCWKRCSIVKIRIVFSVFCSDGHAPSHVSRQVCKFMRPPAAVCQRIGPVVLQALYNHGENLSESFVRSLFVRYTVCFSVLVLKMSCSAAAGALKSWSS